MQQEILIYNGRPVKRVQTTFYAGLTEDTSVKLTEVKDPGYAWKGRKIAYDLWVQIACFLRWTQKEFKEEALITLFYNTNQNTWAAWAFPQEPNGMAIKSLQDDHQYKEDRKKFGTDWIQFGSVHHHCTSKAFQSSTDRDDEISRDGIHITLGDMTDDQMDVHCRQVFNGIMSDTTLSEWVEAPAWIAQVPKALRHEFTYWAMTCIREEPFPEDWKSRVKKKVFTGGRQTEHHAGRTTIISPTTLPGHTKKNSGGVVSGSYNGPDWRSTKVAIIRKISDDLGINLHRANSLISNIPTPNWMPEDVVIRTELIKRITENGIVPLFAEYILSQELELTT